MARQADAFKDLLLEYEAAEADCTKKRRALNEADDHRKRLLAEIVHKMGKSKVGTLDGEDVFEIKPSGRRSVPIAKVYEVCPQLADQLITVSDNIVLKWIRKGIKK